MFVWYGRAKMLGKSETKVFRPHVGHLVLPLKQFRIVSRLMNVVLY